MNAPLPIPKREAEAKREIGLTDISPVGKSVLLVAFVILFLLGTLGQLFHDMSSFRTLLQFPAIANKGWQRGQEEGKNRLFAANRELLATMDDWETEIEDTAWFHGHLLRAGQPLLWRLGSGNGQAIPGRDGWLNYQPDLKFLTHRPFDASVPVEGIQAFHDALADLGIRLLVVPAPVKPQIHPESISRTDLSRPLTQAAEDEVYRQLEARGIATLDLRKPLAEFAKDSPAYLRTDPHWTPEAMRHAADLAIKKITALEWTEPGEESVALRLTEREITHHGDITAMLGLAEGQTLIPPETIVQKEVDLDSDAAPKVLLLGDSFSNIFSLEAMGWGKDGGFGEHLAASLRHPVRRRVRNDAGASATRDMIAREMARGQNPLEGIEVVVWQFAARELKFGNWEPIPFSLRDPPDTPETPPKIEGEVRDGGLIDGFETLTVTATVAAVSSIPRPGQVAYADHVATVHLRDVQSEAGDIINAEAVARFQSMRNRTLLEASGWRSGTRLRLRLIPFSDVESQYGSLNTSELDDLDLMLATPFWIEEVLP
ncbi:MAG: hypothetical protein LAT83_18225 [Kiritimatiellae bacterium]|nr:hypothetical protein [Kiritimatiellia bacterium]